MPTSELVPLSTGAAPAPSIMVNSDAASIGDSTSLRDRVIGGSIGGAAALAVVGVIAFVLLRQLRRRAVPVPDIVVAGAGPSMTQRRGSLPVAAALASRRLSLMSVESLVVTSGAAGRGHSSDGESDGAGHPPSPGNGSSSGHGIYSDDSHAQLFPLSRSGSMSTGSARSPDVTPPAVPAVPVVFSPLSGSGSDESAVDPRQRQASYSNDPYVDSAGALRVRNPDDDASMAPRGARSPFFAPRQRNPLRRMPSTVDESPGLTVASFPWTTSSGEGSGSGGSGADASMLGPATPADLQHVNFGATPDSYFPATTIGRAQ